MRENANLPFELAEYRRRLAALRERMAERGIDVALISIPENIYYLTGYTTLGYYMYQTLLVPMEGEPLLLTYREERINIERLSWLERFVNYGVGEDPIEVTARTVREVASDTRHPVDRGERLLLPDPDVPAAGGRTRRGDLAGRQRAGRGRPG